ncbi:MAG: Omp28-related outer membrane protein [Bacteroidetes bacterium]|nr:Omp28-related outer membrane protein [Bacteroidota bacterium]
MKHIILIIFTLLLFSACDKVKNPNQNPSAISSCTLNAPIVKTNTLTSGFRKVLLEDYTGHTCGNCPRAAEKAEALSATYKDSLVVIANHVSVQYAKPVADTLYREDFRDASSTDWDIFLGMSSSGLPRGTINRVAPFPQSHASWPSLVPSALHQAQSVKLDIITTYDPSQTLLNVQVKSTFLKAFTGDVKLVLALTQDSLVGDQKDYSPPPGVLLDADFETRPNYRFDHVLISTVTGPWGRLVKSSPAVNDTVTLKSSCYLLSKCFFKSVVCLNDKYVNLVAFIYNDATKEILQAEKIRIR